MKSNFILATVLTLLSSFTYAGTLVPEQVDWPRWRGPDGDGISQDSDWNPNALNDGPKILWQAEVGKGFSNVVIKDDRLFAMGSDKSEVIVFCLDAKSGSEIWRFKFKVVLPPQWGTLATPVIDENKVYALSPGGDLLCLQAKDGKKIWHKSIADEYHTLINSEGYGTSPVIDGELVILNVNSSGMAFDKNTGDPVWTSPNTTASPATDHDATPILYYGGGIRRALLFSRDGLYSINAGSGEIIWYFKWFDPSGSRNIADPIISENYVFICTGETLHKSVLIRIANENPSVVWQNDNLVTFFSSAVLVDGYLYGSHGDETFASLRCVDFNTGKLKWEAFPEGKAITSLIAADGKLIILSEKGTLHIAKATPEAYTELATCRLPVETPQFWTPPVLYKGRIYVRNWRGDLVCIDMRYQRIHVIS